MPATHVQAPAEQLPRHGPRVFLAGGITGVTDWQSAAVALFDAGPRPVVLLNPRRDDFDVTDPAMGAGQIAWEYAMLRAADAVLFWFADGGSVQPITLFELGATAERGVPIAVGTDPAYPRAFDVREQLRLRRPEVEVRTRLEDVVGDVWRAVGE
ncbi:hypothetical protein Afil01_08860 [Actinorhabdospora filicis]|uniref:Nucleoside 2-deoxyribosyltransferase-like protein n=1 Tax=Actinorhabdospora filicis TaxID=1785913 RepID=A0A9W6SF81_9ACTN|nr:nucleoside 2-deoxyribosyltransferase domain-containing protein [Actinorhabdospora filicis]GLZ76079.1 hypothetical protein Afil01_08860 [Actinorhabdospora filicis]